MFVFRLKVPAGAYSTVGAGLVAAVAAVGAAVWQRAAKAQYRAMLHAEAGQREIEERYRTMLLSIGDGVIVSDVEGRVTLTNPVAEALTGWKQEEATDTKEGQSEGEISNHHPAKFEQDKDQDDQGTNIYYPHCCPVESEMGIYSFDDQLNWSDVFKKGPFESNVILH